MTTACAFIDGFDHYNSNTYLAMKWSIVLGSGFTWGSALHAGSGSALTMASGSSLGQDLSGASAGEGRFAYYFSRGTDAQRDLMYIWSDAACTTQIGRVQWNADGTFTVYNSANSSVTSSTLTALAGTVIHIEVVITRPSSQFLTLYVNGVAFITTATIKASPSNISGVTIGGTGSVAGTGTAFTIDHLSIVLGTVGTITQQGPSEVMYFPPTADGTTNNWTASTGSSKYAMVNENPPDLTTYDFPTATNSQMFLFAVSYPAGYTAKDYGLTTLGHQSGSETLANRHSATDGGAESNFTTTKGAFGLGDSMVQGTETGVAGPTLVGGNAFLGVRRTA